VIQTALPDPQPPNVQEAFQFLLATAMHEAGKFELLNQVPLKRKATCVNCTGGFLLLPNDVKSAILYSAKQRG